MKQTLISKNLEDMLTSTDTITDVIRKNTSFQHATIVTLTGDLGAGKTTLVQQVGRAFEITEPISSPTFVITKYYDLVNQPWDRLIHIDAYRLDGEDPSPLKFEELFADTRCLIFIEWPEYIQSLLPASRIDISITHNTDDSRTIDVDYNL